MLIKIFLKIRYYKFHIIKELILSKGIDLAKSNSSKECMIFHCWLLNHQLKFQDSVCNGCHVFTMLYVNISNIAITKTIIIDYRCIIYFIRKNDLSENYFQGNTVLNFSLFKEFFLLFMFSIY